MLDPPAVRRRAGQQTGELVAAQPGHQVGAGERGEPLRHADQHLVSGGVSVAVVDLLEVVQVEHHRDEWLPGGVGEQGGGQPEERAAVRQPGERIVAGGVPLGGQLGLEQLDLGFGAQRAAA